MIRIVNNYLVFLLVFSALTVEGTAVTADCKIGGYDLSLLAGEWISASDGRDYNYTYTISVCSALKQNSTDPNDCHADTRICMDLGNGTKLSAGNASDTVHTIVANNETGDVWFYEVGDVCPEQPLHNMTTSINFKCGPLIGSPKLLEYSYCVNYFEWESHVFCKGKKPEKDVRCYMYDDKMNRYDLSPLAMKQDGYLVSSEMDTDVYINVCRDINPVTMAQGCEGSGACRKTRNTAVPLGYPTEGLKRNNNGQLELRYTSPRSPYPGGCTSPPTTTITFICPKRGGSKDPLLLGDFDCQYLIEWETEYACPESTLTNSSCVLTKASADIDIDLRPLKNTIGDNYLVNHTDSHGEEYRYYMNVCEEVNIPCPDSAHQAHIGACQTKVKDEYFGENMGRSDQRVFRYADNKLTLTYKGGSKCPHNNFKRTTVIEFICKQDASDNGRGAPVFTHDSDCVYSFEWETKYACLDHPVNEECRVNYKGNRYDLSSLVRTHDGNWLGVHDNNDEFGTGQYFINICHDVLQEQGASQCDPGAAVCYRDASKGFTRHLGRYEENPVYLNESGSIQIQYRNGDACGPNKKILSTINFMCKPGELQSAPVLVHVSNDKCFYDFEWHTAAACVLGHVEGADCKVEDTKSGFSFDLTPLKKSSGSYYNISDGGSHDFLINVCGPTTGTKCDTLDGASAVGICQVSTGGDDGTPYSAGAWSSKLLYFDGMINLTYTDGTLYNNDAKTPRKSEITFLCDPVAGIGKPRYLTEIASKHYYGFEWRTSYACPTQPMKCSAFDGNGLEYDLSRLSHGSEDGNWMLKVPGEKKTFYLNVCRNLNKVNVPGGCNTFASACTTKTLDNGNEVVDVGDFGHIKSGLMVEGNGRLNLTYEGEVCNGTRKYTTTIYFICRPDALVSGPDEPIKNGDCGYTIIWNTAAACSLSTPEFSEECTVKDNVTNYVYNLQPLRKPNGEAYTVKDGDVEYKLNICGNLSTTVCGAESHPVSVCQVKKDKTKVSLAEDKHHQLEISSNSGFLVMTYEGVRLFNGDRVKVEIQFLCQPQTEIGEPTFLRHEHDTYMFQFLTSLACPPMTVDCMVQSEDGSQYNLASLAKDDAWTALDTTDANTKYYINVCKPVNNIGHCPAEPIGGCQHASNDVWHNMGYVQSKPLARSDGSLTLTYRNGDICHKLKPNQSHRSTRINFYCSETEEGPVFQTETNLCEYVFAWRTPAACKLQTSEGHNCKVIDPLYSFMFNLAPLHKKGQDYHIHSGEYEYILNVCGPLQENMGACDPSTGVGACFRKPSDKNSTTLSTGKSNSEVIYSSGELSLVYKDGHHHCQTIIKFTCDYNKDGLEGPIFIEKTRNCEFIFEWATLYACTPFKVGSCYATDPSGNNYDLSSLTMSNDNYESTENTNGGRKKFIFNVCHSLVHKPNATCEYNAAACMIDLEKADTDPSKYTNIGEVNSQQVQFKDGYLMLNYTNGSPCKGGGHTTTYIEFICDKDAKNTIPTGHFFIEGSCTHHFMWSSAAACAIEEHKPDVSGQGGELTCKTTNPATGKVYDMSSLKVAAETKSWSVNDTTGHLLEFNVCGPLTSSKCTNASNLIGVCQSEFQGQKRRFNAGNSLNDVFFEDYGIAVLNFTGGDRCHNGQYQRNTIITFVCNNHNGLGRPVYLDELSDCTYYISWHTDLVCENQVKCSVTTDDFHTIDLSPLSRHPDNIVHSSEDGELYYLSICSALTPVSGVMCPPGAGACLVKGGSGKKHLSLGRPKTAPTYDPSSKQVSLIYTNGSQCDFDPTQNFTTKVLFSCLPGPLRANPSFIGKVGCQYVFDWQTSVVCYEKKEEKPTDDCGFHDYQTGTFYNFTSLSKTDGYYTVQAEDKYYINPCKAISKSGCASGMVCRESKSKLVSFGAPKNYSFERLNTNVIKMSYASDNTCPDGSLATSEILFKCNRDKDVGQPKYFTGIQCHIQFIWETNFVCPQIEQPCTLVDNGHLFDLTLLSKDNGAWNVSDSEGNSYWINICSSLNRGDLRGPCGRDAGACRKTTHGYEMLGSVSAQKPLLRDSKTKAIVLEYEQGGSVCSHDRRRTDKASARTRINFVCGKTYGGPVFNESKLNKEECLFEFTWKTKIACEVEREEVEAKNGTVFDPHSGGTINLQPLLHKKYSFEELLPTGDKYTYELLLDGTSTQCTDGAVCLIQTEKTRTVLGTYSSRKFYIDDEDLEAVYTTNQKCSKTFSKMNVTSIIQFHCSVQTGSPVLLSRSKECIYIFSWDTPMACLTAQVIQPTVVTHKNTEGGDKSGTASSTSEDGSKSNTVATVFGVFIVAIALCVLVVVFHKHERRAACVGGLRRLIWRRSSDYSQLPTAATDDFPVEDETDEVVTITDAAETETGREEEPFVHVSKKVYHDDSDEDMLL